MDDFDVTGSNRRSKRITLLTAGVLAASAMLAGCSGSPSGTATTSPSSRPALRLPALPPPSQKGLLIRVPHGVGPRSFQTGALASKRLVLQLACASGKASVVSLRLFQQGAKPIYQISRQPCNGTVQKITLTADTTQPVRAEVASPAGTIYELTISQG